MNQCCSCRARCGKFCCENHITWFHTTNSAGAVCKDCQGSGCIMTIVGLMIIALVVFSQMGR